jgi:hypothetical protein
VLHGGLCTAALDLFCILFLLGVHCE